MQQNEKTKLKWKPRLVEILGYKDKIVLGHKHLSPIVQSMLDVPFQDTDACLKQITDLQDAGCRLIRLSIPNAKSLVYAEKLITKLQNRNIPHILSADIHFAPGLAFESLSAFHKVRINPGNFVEKNQGRSDLLSPKDILAIKDKMEEEFFPIVNKAAMLGRVLRIGVNHGSLSDRMIQEHGDTALGMVESAFEYLRLAAEWNFSDFVISLKSSRTTHMIEANELFVSRAMKEGFMYPLHLGITEAGSGEDARIKSTLAMAYLLQQGIGETIRVSLAENPVQEIPVARSIIKYVEKNMPTQDRALRLNFAGLLNASKDVEVYSAGERIKDLETLSTSLLTKLLKFSEDNSEAKDITSTLNQKTEIIYIKKHSENQKELSLPNLINVKLLKTLQEHKESKTSIKIINSTQYSIDLCVKLSSSIFNSAKKIFIVETEQDTTTLNWLLQSAGIRSHETEFIACPGCARTLFDLQEVTEKLKKTFSGNPNLKIAVMGCIVNGPGEMADADYGYVGAGTNRIDLYKGKKIVLKSLAPEDADVELIKLIREDLPELKTS